MTVPANSFSPPPPAGLQVQGLCKQHGPQTVLDGLELTVQPGEFVAIVGESGAGKSTFLNLVAGLDQADAGAVIIGGTDVTHLDDGARTVLRRQKLGFVFQSFHVLPHLTLQQNVELPLVLLGTGAGERATRARALLAEVGLAGRENSWPRELSGGEMQRVAVARALVHRPALVLADEPTGNLDPDTAGVILQLLVREVRSHGAAGVLVTHSLAAAEVADRVLVLDHGRLIRRDGFLRADRVRTGVS